jgi:hypothetical protein
MGVRGIERPADRDAVIDLMVRNALALDELDVPGVEACYADSIDVQFPGWEEPRQFSPSSWAARCLRLTQGFDVTQHFLGQHSVEFTGADDAHTTTYLRAMHYFADPALTSYEVGGRYLHDLRRIDGTWKIVRWRFRIDWEAGDPGAFRVALDRQPRLPQ